MFTRMLLLTFSLLISSNCFPAHHKGMYGDENPSYICNCSKCKNGKPDVRPIK